MSRSLDGDARGQHPEREAPRPPSLDSALAGAIDRAAPTAQVALRQAATAAVEAGRFRSAGNLLRAGQWEERVARILDDHRSGLGPAESHLADAVLARARGDLARSRIALEASGLARGPEQWRTVNATLATVVPERYQPYADRAPILGQENAPADAAERARLDALSPAERRHDAHWHRIMQSRVPTEALQRGFDTTAQRLGQDAALELVAARRRAAPERASAPERQVMDVLAALGQGDPRSASSGPTRYEREYRVPGGPPGPVDFARPDLQRAIEVYGGAHFGWFNQDGVRALKDEAKLEQLADAGWSVLVLSERDLRPDRVSATRAAIAEFWAITPSPRGRQAPLPW